DHRDLLERGAVAVEDLFHPVLHLEVLRLLVGEPELHLHHLPSHGGHPGSSFLPPEPDPVSFYAIAPGSSRAASFPGAAGKRYNKVTAAAYGSRGERRLRGGPGRGSGCPRGRELHREGER